MTSQTMMGHITNDKHATERQHSSVSHYKRFAIMVILSFVSMYILMYAMVHTFGDVFNSVNQLYMAGLMAAPMAVIEILLMGSMYSNKRINIGILVISVIAGVLFWIAIRTQFGIGDRQFIRSMVPHHSGALLMCNKANLQNTELKELCGQIIKGQQDEINQMNEILRKL